jgi:adenylate kinase family enzyme
MIIGNAAGGKSRLGKHIAKQQSLPYHALDHLLWRPQWRPAPQEDFTKAHTALITSDAWVIDGIGSWPSLEARLARADTLIFVDLPFAQHLWWATKRQLASLFFGRDDAPEGCKMWPVTIRLYKMMWWMHRTMRPRFTNLAKEAKDDKTVLHITSRKALTAALTLDLE